MSQPSSSSSKSPLVQALPTPLSRRGMISVMSATVGLAIGTQLQSHSSEAKASLPEESDQSQRPQGLDEDDFIVHGYTPITLEAKRHIIGTSVITDERHLYIRNNLPLPDRSIIDQADEWQLTMTGVNEERTIALSELKTLGLSTIAAVLQCSGNGRAFYTHGPSGSQWSTGAAGCVIWSGVKLSDVVTFLGGAKPGMNYVTSTGGDPLPQGVDPLAVKVERSVPLDKALNDALLAWEMNGQPLSIEHGGPLRLIVPGYFGCNQIKYVKQIALTADQTKAKIQRSGYRLRPIGQKGSPSFPTMWAMPVKSWITNQSELYGQRQIIRGVAMGGERPISKVEISLNEGQSWREAHLIGPDLGRFAWRLFQLPVQLPVGQHILMSRAYDDQGNLQPEHRHDNERGYGHNGWRDHGLPVTVHSSSLPPHPPSVIKHASTEEVSPHTQTAEHTKDQPKYSDSAQRGRQVFLTESAPACGVCHTVDDAGTKGVVGPNLDELKPSIERIKRAVQNGLGAMPAQPQLSATQLDDLAHYIFEATRAK